MLETALKLANLQFSVFPCWGIRDDLSCACGKLDCSAPGKHPCWPLVPHGHVDATQDPAVVRQWFESGHTINLAVAPLGSLFILDIDGPSGEDWLRDRYEDCGPILRTTTARTPKGRHIFLLGDGSLHCRVRVDGADLDVRAQGGYVVVPPSRHVSGKLYEWEFPPWDVPIATAPDWLLARLRPAPKTPPSPSQSTVDGAGVEIVDSIERYAKHALAAACNAIRTAPAGEGNQALNNNAVSVFRLMLGGYLTERENARGELFTAATEGGRRSTHETDATLDSAWKGAQKLGPRVLRQREQPVQQPVQGAELVSIVSLIDPALERFRRRYARTERPVPTGFSELDAALAGGYWPGAHVLVAGTGAGKTQLVLQQALASIDQDIPVDYVGLELDADQIIARLVGIISGKQWSNFWTGRASDEDWIAAREIVDGLKAIAPRFTAELGCIDGWPSKALYERARRLRATYPTGPILEIVDYLQLVDDGDVRLSERKQADLTIRRARQAARDFGVSVLLVSSMSRANYAKDLAAVKLDTTSDAEHRKTLRNAEAIVGSAKESGAVEYTADSVTVVHRWPGRDPKTGNEIRIAFIPKVRWCAETWLPLAWTGGQFLEMPHVRAPEDLPALERAKDEGRGRERAEPVSAASYEERVLGWLKAHPDGVRSARELRIAKLGKHSEIQSAWVRLRDSNRIVCLAGMWKATPAPGNYTQGP
jgi:replicative DNA helicase